MPANVTAEYLAAERRYIDAKNDEEKLSALHEMLKTAPKHKGSEKLIAEITRKIKKLKTRIEKKEIQRKKVSGKSISVKKTGIGQIAFIGIPNSGKSTVLNALTKSNLEVGSYPFTTYEPKPVMLSFNNALIQLVEIPAIIKGSAEGKASGSEFLSVARNADAIVLVLDSDNLINQFNLLTNELKKAGVLLNKKKPAIKIKKSKFKGITITGTKFLKLPVDTLKAYLKSKGFHNTSILISEKVDLNDFENVLNTRLVYKKAFAVIVNKNKKLNNYELNNLKKKIKVIEFDSKNTEDNSNETLNKIKNELFDLLDIILVYTKKPGEKNHSKKPLALRKGATVEDAAELVHKEFKNKLKYARIWGSIRFAGQKVKKEYKLKNNDIIEFYA